MATNNAVNTNLSGQTGTGNFVGGNSPTIETPSIVSALYDSNGVEILQLIATTSAVNNFAISNVITGSGPNLAAIGPDPAIPVNITAKGTGAIVLTSENTTTPLSIKSGTSSQHTTNFLFSNTSATRSVTFPDSDGTVAFTSNLMTWSGVAGTSQAAAVNNGYVIQNASQTTVTLPATAALGSVVSVRGLGAGGWILRANTGQTIKYVTATTSSGGTLTSAEQYDSIDVTCIVANTTWIVSSAATTGLTVA